MSDNRLAFLCGIISAALLALIVTFPAQAHSPAPATPAPVQAAVSGTVDELIVEDRVNNTTLRFQQLRLEDGSAIALTGEAAVALATGTRVGLTGRWSGNAFETTHAEVLAPAAQPVGDTVLQANGTLVVIHADDFDNGKSQFLFQVHDDAGGITSLDVAPLPAALRGGMRVIVSGTRGADASSLRAQRITILSAPSGIGGSLPSIAPKAATINSVLVIMANFNNTVAPAFTQAQAQQVMTTNANSVSNFYNEMSFGQQKLNVTVTPTWVTMSMAKPATCDWSGIGSAADTAATAAGYNPSNYGFVVYLFTGSSQGGPSCGWSGLAYVGFPHRAWINGTNSFGTLVVAHEMGHNFGLYHAGSLNCGAATIGGACNVAEYGDPWDTMGNQRPMHFNAMQKSLLNWIPASSVKTHGTGTATYTLAPIENGGGAVYAVKVPTANAYRTYWIEFRQPIGFDAALAAFPNNGAQIRVSSPFEVVSGADDTEILDMTPGSAGGFGDSALVVGQSFLDSSYNVNIMVTAATAAALTVSVTTSSGAATTTTLSSSANPSTAAANVTFTATVTGTNPTGIVNFTDGGSNIAGCASVGLVGAGNTRTAACTTNTLTAGVHSIVATYGGDAGNASSNGSLSQTVKSNTTTGVGSSLTPSTVGINVTFTATVTGTFPTGTANFKDGAASIAGCAASALTGAGNIRTASCTTAGLAAGNHSITATYGGDSINNGSSSAVFTQVVNVGGGGASTNVALASNGGVASASSTSGGYPVSAINDGDRAGLNFGAGGVWKDGTRNTFPDWVEIDFSVAKTIDHVIVYSLQDNYTSPVDPSNTLTFTLRGLTAFDVQAWNGAAWVTLGSVTGNSLVKRSVSFAATTTSKIRVLINATASGNFSFVTEVEAWTSGGPPPPPPPPASGTTLASSLNPVKVGQSVTFTATVTGTNPTGNVAFTNGGSPIAGCTAVALSGAGNSKTALCTTTFTAQGTYAIGASYGGNAGNPPSAATPLSQVVKSKHP